jgi:type II secretory pathway predicted ATPase ExeA
MSNARLHSEALALAPKPAPGSTTRATVEASIAAFGESRDTRYFFGGEQAGSIVDALVGLVTGGDMGLGLVVGDPGCGKTLLRSELHRRLAGLDCVCVTLENGWLGFDETLLELLSQLEGRRVQSAELPGRYDRLAAVKQSLLDRVVRAGRHLALLIDEAQQLDDATLEGVRSLTNISAERQNFMTPILFGQPSLADRVSTCPALASRIRMTHRMLPLSESGTAAYLRHRIEVATGSGEGPFTTDAIRILHRESGGLPRIINQRCKSILEAALERRRVVVDLDMFDEDRAETDSCRSWPDSCLLSG